MGFAKRRKSVKRKKFKRFLKDLIVTLIQLFKELKQRCSQLTQNKIAQVLFKSPNRKNFSANVQCRAFISHARLVSRLLFRENSKNCSKSKPLLKPPCKVRRSPISDDKVSPAMLELFF